MSACSLPNLDLSSTFGVDFWGFLISAVLLGVSLVQGYLYYSNNSDAWLMKGFVSVVLALDVAGTLLVAESMHYYLIKSFGNPFALLEMTQTFITEFIISVIIILLSQLFYASRIYNAGMHDHGRYVALFVASLAIFSFGAGLAVSYELFAIDRLILNLTRPKIKMIIGIFDFSAALCDAVATFSMCYFLSSHHSSFKTTKSLLNWLFFFSINRGFLVCATQIAFVATYLAWPEKTYWMPFHLALSKLHVNTLLAMLNSRPVLLSQLQGRVNYIERSSSSTPGHYLSPVRLQSVTDAERSEGTYVSVDKKHPLSPRRLTQSDMQTNQSFNTSDEVNEYSGIELVGVVKAPSIV